MTDRKINGAVLQSGRLFKAGDEAELALVLPPFDVTRLIDKGVLSGDWSAPLLNDSTSGDLPSPVTHAAPPLSTPRKTNKRKKK